MSCRLKQQRELWITVFLCNLEKLSLTFGLLVRLKVTYLELLDNTVCKNAK